MIKLIDSTERFVLECFGAKFFYRRILPTEKQNIIKKNSQSAIAAINFNWNDSAIEVCEVCLLGWSGVVDLENKEIEFDRDYVGMLPEKVLLKLQIAIDSVDGITEEELEKNS